jgi:hypothetical protein
VRDHALLGEGSPKLRRLLEGTQQIQQLTVARRLLDTSSTELK